MLYYIRFSPPRGAFLEARKNGIGAMSRDYLKRWIGTHAALAFLLLPVLCAFPLLALITPPSPARALFLGVWALLALALTAIVVRVAIRLRRVASDELRRRAVADNDERLRGR
jgi:TRAP-type uncharacterized transport system fused permease subunit